MLPALLAAALCLQEPPPGQVAAGEDRHSAVRIVLSGHAELHFTHRDRALNEAGVALGLAAPSLTQDSFWSGRVGLRADVTLKHDVSAVLELENKDFDEGANVAWGTDPEDDLVRIQQAYVEVARFVDAPLTLRLGVQDVRVRNRALDEPFFLDLGESESFSAGFSTTGNQVNSTADRDVREAVGLKLTWDVAPVASVHALGMVYGEAGASKDDEQVYAILANAAVSDRLALWLMAAWVAGAGHDQDVWTVAAGADLFLGGTKGLELFAEGYLQRGHLVQHVRKSAFAFQAGARVVDVVPELLWLEAACALRTGNEEPGDGRDETFQSYENENRFLILQSAEFGLDVDTNVRLARLTAGLGPLAVAGRPLRLQLDLGNFTADEPVSVPSGALSANRRHWGFEADLGATWAYSESLSFWVKGSGLWRSGVLERLTPDREDDAVLAVAGADLRF